MDSISDVARSIWPSAIKLLIACKRSSAALSPLANSAWRNSSSIDSVVDCGCGGALTGSGVELQAVPSRMSPSKVTRGNRLE